MTTSQTPIADPTAMSKLKQLVLEYGNTGTGWDQAWQRKITPWDVGQAQPPLLALIESNRLQLPRSGKAFVPGCGRGQDAILIASTLGFDTLAVDISPTAVEAAKELLKSAPVTSRGKVSFEVLDFFTFAVPDNQRFDIIYDYTFFVAIPPAKRLDWAQQMATMIKPGGHLITLIFPLNQPKEGGPPFYVEYEHYEELLGKRWEKVLDEIPEISMQSHVGKERLVVWKRKTDN